MTVPSEAALHARHRDRSRRSWYDPAVLGVGAGLLTVTYCVVSWPHPIMPPLIGWMLTWFCAAMPVVAAIQTARDPAVPAAARRFWARYAASVLVSDLALVSTARDALTGPDAPSVRVSPITAVIYLVGLVIYLATLLSAPAGKRSGTEWLTFALDAGTVATGSALFLWRLSFGSASEWANRTGSAPMLLAILALGCLTVLVLLKVAFAGVREVDPDALRILAASLFIATSLVSLAPLLVSRPYLNSAFLGIPIGFYISVLAAERQRRTSSTAVAAAAALAAAVVARRRRRNRRLSLLPYAAVALTDGLLLASVHGRDDEMTVAVGVVVLTALVVARQVIASRENDRLLGQLDRTVGELRLSEDRLSHQASHDELTGLANRALFGRCVQAALSGATDPSHVAVALVDLDDFKVVNDRLGHIVGDDLLIATADRLRDSVGPADAVARLGGDEFAILLHPDQGDDLADRLDRQVENILGSLAEPLTAGGQDLLIRASLGVTTGAEGADPLELLRRADLAMYAAKEQGNGSWTHYHPDLDARAAEQARTAAGIRTGLARGEFQLLYQPIVALPDGQLLGVEALIRWDHPERGLLEPLEFIPHAERTGLIIPLGRWVLREACRQAASWRAEYGPLAPARVAVNVSPRQLRDRGLITDIVNALDATGLPASALVLEVTETAVVDGGAPTDILRELRTLGIRVALDDFGTGHSSLGLLLTCPVDILKIDKTFIDGVAHGGDQAVIVTFLSDVASGLHLQTIAEGVETQAQATRLHELGYRQAQGYLFNKPLPPHGINALITDGASNAWRPHAFRAV
jgi:diguanylate cyclase (GGDEF)-like protein